LLALPIIFFQIWSFILPALKNDEKKYLLILVPLSYIFFIVGSAFGLFLVIPFGMKFFLGFTSANLEAMFSLSKYISFIISILIPFGLVFELPLLITLLVKLGIISSNFLTTNRKYVIVAIFLFAAILTPPDIISQAMMAIPLILLYEGSVIIAKIIE
jgi:sec-independent protein translocase protein TatC